LKAKRWLEAVDEFLYKKSLGLVKQWCCYIIFANFHAALYWLIYCHAYTRGIVFLVVMRYFHAIRR